MIQLIQLCQGILRFRITSGAAIAAAQCDGRIELDLGESGAVSELHHRELMDFIEPFNPKSARHIVQLCLELLRAHTSVSGIDFNLLDRNREVLKLLRSADIAVELVGAAIKGACSEKYVTLSFYQS